MSEWAKKQYNKIQDFVIYNKLYKGKPDNLSHADIVIDLAKKQLEAQQKDSADVQSRCICDKCGQTHPYKSSGESGMGSR